MPALTETSLLDLTNKILQRLGEPKISDVAQQTSGKGKIVLDAIDDVYQMMINEFDWPYVEHIDVSLVTTSGTREYSIPESVDEATITAVKLANHGTIGSATAETHLAPLPWNEFSRDYPIRAYSGSTGASQVPKFYSIFQRKIYLDPIPGSNSGNNYTLVIAAAQNMSSLSRASTGSTTFLTQLPLGYEHMLIDAVMAAVLMPINLNVALAYEAKYNKAVDQMKIKNTAAAQYRIKNK